MTSLSVCIYTEACHVGQDELSSVDKSGFPLSCRPTHAICKRGIESPQSVIRGSGREIITVQVCPSSSGQLLRPYIILYWKTFDGKLYEWWSSWS